MSYALIEAAVITVLAIHGDFDTDNVKAGDSLMIGKGYERAVRVSNGGHTDKGLTLALVERTWTIFLDLYVPYRGALADLNTRLNTERQKVIDQMALYPRLNNLAGVRVATLDQSIPPEPLNPKHTVYRGQRNRLIVIEIVKPARAG